jgi:hypothetical protein
MLSRAMAQQTLQVQIRPIDRFVSYVRNPRKNDAAIEWN